jgi:hypothetical protein
MFSVRGDYGLRSLHLQSHDQARFEFLSEFSVPLLPITQLVESVKKSGVKLPGTPLLTVSVRSRCRLICNDVSRGWYPPRTF